MKLDPLGVGTRGRSLAHYKYGKQPDAALLGLGRMPPASPSDGTPLQLVIPPSEASLGDESARHIGRHREHWRSVCGRAHR